MNEAKPDGAWSALEAPYEHAPYMPVVVDDENPPEALSSRARGWLADHCSPLDEPPFCKISARDLARSRL